MNPHLSSPVFGAPLKNGDRFVPMGSHPWLCLICCFFYFYYLTVFLNHGHRSVMSLQELVAWCHFYCYVFVLKTFSELVISGIIKSIR